MSARLAAPSAAVLVVWTSLFAGACSPSLSPLYRDYKVDGKQTPVEMRIEAALEDAGWHPAPASAPNAFATTERKVSNWGIYSVFVSLEVVPVGADYVRLYVHPYRKYFTGGRGKIPYLNKGLRRAILADLNEAFARHGLRPIGTSVERDKAATAH